MIMLEYNYEKDMETQRKEAKEEGREEMVRFMLLDGMKIEQVARIARMSVDEVERIKRGI